MTWLLVVAGAAVGAPLRYWTDRFVQARHGSVLPWGTLVVNVAASLLLGAVTGATMASTVDPRLQPLIGTGLCGALSTYSTFSFETLQLSRAGARLFALANVALTLVVGLAAYRAGIVAVGRIAR